MALESTQPTHQSTHTQPTYEMTPGFKNPFTVFISCQVKSVSCGKEKTLKTGINETSLIDAY